MKSLFIFSLLFAGALQAQVVPNGSFENWQNNLLWQDPPPFQTTNLQAFFSGGSNPVNKLTVNPHGGLCAARLTTTNVNGQLIPGALTIGTPEEDGVSGGIPFDGRPETMSCWARHNIAANDSAVVFCIFTVADFPIGVCLIKLTGMQSSWDQYFSEVIWMSDVAPDHLVVIAVNTAFDNPQPASWLELDDVEFTYSSEPSPPFPNGDFEEWVDVETNDPVDWNTSNMLTLISQPSVEQSTQAYSGMYAARVVSRPSLIPENPNLGFLLLGTLGENGITGGIDLNGQVPTALKGYYRYDAAAIDDSALVFMALTRYNSLTLTTDTLFEERLALGSAGSYTPFNLTIPNEFVVGWLFSGILPEKMIVAFASTRVDEEGWIAPEGSALLVDDILVSVFGNVNELVTETSVYPNPASSHIQVQSTGQLVQIDLLDMNGRLIHSQKTLNNFCQLPVSALANGTYVIQITTTAGTTRHKIDVKH